MKGYRKYFTEKLIWFLITLICAFLLNFILPRLMPGDPVAVITQRVAQGMTSQSRDRKRFMQQYAELFGTNKPMLEQFFLYMRNVASGQFWYLVQPISQTGFRHSQIFDLVDDCSAVPGDHRRLADREHAWRVGSLSQEGL